MLGRVDGAVAGGGITAGDGHRGPCTNQVPRGVARLEVLPRSSTTLALRVWGASTLEIGTRSNNVRSAAISAASGALRGVVSLSPTVVVACRVKATCTDMPEAKTAVACAFKLLGEERR